MYVWICLWLMPLGIDCKEGDEAIIFGDDPTAEILAESAGTISYELITGISQRVKRVIIT